MSTLSKEEIMDKLVDKHQLGQIGECIDKLNNNDKTVMISLYGENTSLYRKFATIMKDKGYETRYYSGGKSYWKALGSHGGGGIPQLTIFCDEIEIINKN